MSDWYKLVGKQPVQCDPLVDGSRPLEGDRHVGSDEVGDYWVSTVFLALDHQFGVGPPLLFETMVFPTGTYQEEYCERYSTWEEAEEGHKRAVAKFSAITRRT